MFVALVYVVANGYFNYGSSMLHLNNNNNKRFTNNNKKTIFNFDVLYEN